MEKLVCNSSCIIVLERIKRLDILKKCIKDIFIPVGVIEETNINDEYFSVKEVKDVTLLKSLRLNLGKGEAEAICLAIELDLPVILDDIKARKIAKIFDIKIVGTLGLLTYAKSLNVISNVKQILLDFKENGFRMSNSLFNEVLLQNNELQR